MTDSRLMRTNDTLKTRVFNVCFVCNIAYQEEQFKSKCM